MKSTMHFDHCNVNFSQSQCCCKLYSLKLNYYKLLHLLGATLLFEDFKTELKEVISTIIFIFTQKLQQFPGGFSHLHKLFVQSQQYLHLVQSGVLSLSPSQEVLQ